MPDQLKLTSAADTARKLGYGAAVPGPPAAPNTAYCDGCNATSTTGTDNIRHDPWCSVDRVTTQIRDAAARRERARRQRAQLDAARARGLAARHRQKLAYLAARADEQPPDAA
ncbi:hypothetical protein LO772_16545 [Yinghuangia sp. ASG 101]|uniref:hypothetical protein n=1 Tax=Yinghuangia sp. ASG 101 TaxID=2896848 RepID=UPI001E5FA9A5|nr:hypothetical protein [Yinghuangia sp. ASG 101]UGQ15027.1 hypothetical protein LO772_16545 [Yinghuangia sp. ASG 101]